LNKHLISGHAQSSGAPTEASASPRSMRPEWKIASEPASVSLILANSSSATALPIVSSSKAPFADSKTEQIVSASEGHKSSTPKTEITTEKVQIIMEEFVTSNDTENLTPEMTEIETAVTDTVK
jgi:hypothetical protein